MITTKVIEPKVLVKYLSNKVRDWCKGCKRYAQNLPCCPPSLMPIKRYKRLILSYKNAMLIAVKFDIDSEIHWKVQGRESSKLLVSILKSYAKEFKNHIIFGAGSCKSCDICSNPCKNLKGKVIAVEAIGINVVKLMAEQTDIKLFFPVEKKGYFYRIGLLLW